MSFKTINAMAAFTFMAFSSCGAFAADSGWADAGGICASSQNKCIQTVNAILLLNSSQVSVQSRCVGEDLRKCDFRTPYRIETKIKVNATN